MRHGFIKIWSGCYQCALNQLLITKCKQDGTEQHRNFIFLLVNVFRDTEQRTEELFLVGKTIQLVCEWPKLPITLPYKKKNNRNFRQTIFD